MRASGFGSWRLPQPHSTRRKAGGGGIGKDTRPKLEPRILIEDPAKSYHDPHRVSENAFFDSLLVFGYNHLIEETCDD